MNLFAGFTQIYFITHQGLVLRPSCNPERKKKKKEKKGRKLKLIFP
jgi:hypothetical protein